MIVNDTVYYLNIVEKEVRSGIITECNIIPHTNETIFTILDLDNDVVLMIPAKCLYKTSVEAFNVIIKHIFKILNGDI